jgi:hypothetical protein
LPEAGLIIDELHLREFQRTMLAAHFSAIVRQHLATFVAMHCVFLGTLLADDESVPEKAPGTVLITPESLVFAAVEPGQSPRGVVFIDVLKRPKWELRDVKSDIPNCKLEVRDLTADEKTLVGGSESAKAIEVAVDSKLDFKQELAGTISFNAVRMDGGEEVVSKAVVEVYAKSAPRIEIDGDIRFGKFIDFGVVKSAKGKKKFFTLKVRDAERRLSLKKIETNVEGLLVTVVPQGKESEKNGLYRLTIELPKDAPVQSRLGTEGYGELTMIFDHPRIKPVKFGIQVEVVDED